MIPHGKTLTTSKRNLVCISSLLLTVECLYTYHLIDEIFQAVKEQDVIVDRKRSDLPKLDEDD